MLRGRLKSRCLRLLCRDRGGFAKLHLCGLHLTLCRGRHRGLGIRVSRQFFLFDFFLSLVTKTRVVSRDLDIFEQNMRKLKKRDGIRERRTIGEI